MLGGYKGPMGGDSHVICDKMNLVLKEEQNHLTWVTFGLVIRQWSTLLSNPAKSGHICKNDEQISDILRAKHAKKNCQGGTKVSVVSTFSISA